MRKFVAPEFIFGAGALELAGQYAANFGAQKALLVTDPGIIAHGWTAKVERSLAASGIDYHVFSGVTPNPRRDEVLAGAETFREQGCDVIVVVGGGSPIDCAKGIGIVATSGKDILDFQGIDQVEVAGPPLICIPTTAGSAADVSQFAIVSHIPERIKISIISKMVVPDVALIDPVPTTTMDAFLTACTGMDALVHAIEAYVSTANSPFLDVHALSAIGLVHKHLLSAIERPLDLEAREQMMLACLQAGLAFSNASLGAVHAMAHSLGGLLDLPHGECNSILLDHVMAFNYPAAVERFASVGAALGLPVERLTPKETRGAVLGEITRLKHAAGIVETLSRRGVSSADIPMLAENAMKDAIIATNPRPPVKRDLEVIYEEAM